MRPDKPPDRSKNVIRPEYRKESIADENTRDILNQIVSCERYGQHKITKKGHASDIEKTRLDLRKDDIRDFIVKRLDDKKIPHEKIIDLMTAEGRSWRNFSRVGKVQGKNKEGETTYKNVSTEVSMVAFCAAAQLTNTPLENLIVGFLEYCEGDDNRAGVVIPELIPHKDAVERLKREVREARNARHRIKTPEPEFVSEPATRLPLVRGADSWLNAYNPDGIPFVGRSLEQKLLDEFITCGDPFKIWAIIAPSGAGKTRLMVHWVNTSPALEGWKCRVLEPEDRDNPKSWSAWSPEEPTIIILDYMFGYNDVLRHLIRRCQKPSKFNVRLLVIDHEIAQPIESDERWGFSASGESLDFKKFLFFDERPLSLLKTSDQEEVITHIICTRTKLELSDPKIEEARAYLRRTNAAWHPLFAALVGDAIRNDRDYAAWNRRELIKYYLKGKALTWEDQGEPGQWAACFIAVATARRGVLFNDLLSAQYPEGMAIPDDFEQIINICRKIIPNSEGIALAPFEPDLLGESFFLLFLEKLQTLRSIQPAFRRMLLVGDKNSQTSGAIEFVGFIDRLRENLLKENREHPETKILWRTLLDFLRPLNFPEGHALRFSINACLVEMAGDFAEAAPEEAVELLDRINIADFFGVGSETLYAATVCSMKMLNISCGLKSTPLVVTDDMLELWERNRLNSPSDKEYEPLFVMVEFHFYYLLKFFLSHDDIKFKSVLSSGRTLLTEASMRGYTRIVRLLLDLNYDTKTVADNHGTALMLASANGYVQTVELLLDRNVAVNATDNLVGTPLVSACVTGHIEIVSLLLDRGANIHISDNEGRTALAYACKEGYAEIFALLLDRGANIQDKDKSGTTALLSASHNGRTQTVKMLLDRGADIQHKDEQGFTALMWACTKGHTETVTLLLDGGADIQYGDAEHGVTPLMLASFEGHAETVALLLERGANIQHKSNNGATVLTYASARDHRGVIEMLLNLTVS